jgi:DNA-binding response OmpR family regulator
MIGRSRIRHLFRKSLGREEEISLRHVIESGDFRIDIDRRAATLRGEQLHLTFEEFDVLLFLIKHPQHLITPHTVLATSSTTDAHRQTDFLRVLFSLRNKLDEAGAGKHYLRTEPWIVYRFDSTPSSAT